MQPLAALPRLTLRAAIVLALAALTPHVARAQGALTGIVHVVWHDPASRGGQSNLSLWLVDDQGRGTQLQIAPEMLRRLGGARALDRSRATVAGATIAGGPAAGASRGGAARFDVRSLTVINPAVGRATGAAAVVPPVQQSGAKPYATILCRFADHMAETPHDRAVYQGWAGSSYPGWDHYWREQSGDRINLTGSAVYGWYNLAQPKSYYFPNGPTNTPDFGKLVQDCAGAADADVDFPNYYGINTQFSDSAWNFFWGGSWTYAHDGVPRQYGLTWMGGNSGYAAYGHEMGHSLGLPHSSGPYEAVYDSKWDMMSNEYLYWDAGRTQWIPQLTIGYHKDLLGWIPAAQKVTVPMSARRTVQLDRTAQNPATTAFTLATIPLRTDSSRFYTFEARRFVGYDAHLPGEAVIIHTVTPADERPARVVDADGNGNPNDAGAMWTPGKRFADADNGVFMSVDAATATGFRVTLTHGWPITVTTAGAGTVTGSVGALSCPGTCAAIFASPGIAATLTARAAGGSMFAAWGGDCTGTSTTCMIAVSTERQVSATFAQQIAIMADATRQAAIMGKPYADTLRASGGMGAIVWSIAGGTFPPGLTLNAVNGVVSGIATAAGDYGVTVRATSADNSAFTASKPLSLSVAKPALTVASVIDFVLLGASTLSADDARFLDLQGNRNGRVDIGDVRAWLLSTSQAGLAAFAADHVGGPAPMPLVPPANRQTAGRTRVSRGGAR